MIAVYVRLAEMERASPGLFAASLFAQLDEVLNEVLNESGRAAAGPYARELASRFFDQLAGGISGFLALPASTADAEAAASAHRLAIRRAGGLAFQLLGIGVNGHIGFNEPGSSLASIARPVKLAPSTIARNGFAPATRAVTLGIADILAADQLVLLATGTDKASAVAAMIKGPKTEDCPASLLQDHPGLCIILDEEAASLLETS